MSMVVGKSRFTPDDVLRLEGEERLELVDGQLASSEKSGLAAWIASQINASLVQLVQRDQIGVVFTSDASYRCFKDDPDRVRRPDVSFIHRLRMKPEYLVGHVPIHPDLAVEVVSPNDSYYEVRQKVAEYIEAGVRLVWVVDPETRIIDVYRANRTSQVVQNGDMLDGEDVVPGFTIALAEIFKPPPMAPTA